MFGVSINMGDDQRREVEEGKKNMGPTTSPGNSIHRSSSRPQLDVSKAEIQGNFEEKYPTILLPNQSDDISHLALDLGGMFNVSLFLIQLLFSLFVLKIFRLVFPFGLLFMHLCSYV